MRAQIHNRKSMGSTNNMNGRWSWEQYAQHGQTKLLSDSEKTSFGAVTKSNTLQPNRELENFSAVKTDSEKGDCSWPPPFELPQNKLTSTRNGDAKTQKETAPTKLTSRIPKIFDAIFQEIRTLSPKRPQQSNKSPTLSEVLESNASIVTTQYEIPPNIIDQKTIDCLQTLINRAEKISRRVSSGRGRNPTVDRRGPNILSCYTTITNTRKVLSTDSSSTETDRICRICHGNQDTLVQPCECKGSLAYVHVECLQHWLTQEDINFCELCSYSFNVIHAPDHKVLQSIAFWYKFVASDADRNTIIKDFTVAAVALPCLAFATIYSGSDCPANLPGTQSVADMLVKGCVKLAVFLTNTAFYTGLMYRIHHHVSAWSHWRSNKNVTIVLD